MKVRELQRKIEELKRKKDAIILVHNYQRPEIQDIADYLGDSLGLSREAADTDAELIVFCGVSFMAETATILSPGRKVLLPKPKQQISCPMASMVSVDRLRELKARYPEAAVVSYVNTSAAVKAESDICCTSSNAVEVVQGIDKARIIFVPDRNLASYVSRFTDKDIISWDGYCYVHNRLSAEMARKAREEHPEALLVVHPECNPELVDEADEVLSTGGIVRISRQTNHKKLLIGTEEGILYRLSKENPGKKFYASGIPRACKSMKRIQLEDVYNSLQNEQYPVQLSDQVIENARKALERMLEYA